MKATQDIDSVAKLLKIYKNTKYGVLNRYTNTAYPDKNDQAWRNWRLNTPQQTLKYRVGNCYDTVELTKKVLNRLKIPHQAYFGINKYRQGVQVPSHSFVVYKDKDKWKWLQGSWGPYKNNTLQKTKKQKLVKAIAKLMANTAKADQQIFKLKNIPYGTDIQTYDKMAWSQPVMFTQKFNKKASAKNISSTLNKKAAIETYKGGQIPIQDFQKVLELAKALSKDEEQYKKGKPKSRIESEQKQDQIRKWRYNDPNQNVFIYKVKKQPVGIASSRPAKGLIDTDYIHSVFVSPQYRNKKIGSKLLHAIQKAAKKRKIKYLSLSHWADNSAQHLYERQGFKPGFIDRYKEL